MKPHTMFFDEYYSQKWYRSDEVSDYLKRIDALIVVGTTLQTGKAYQIVSETIQR